MLEVGAYPQLRRLIDAAYDSFTVLIFDSYFKDALIEQQRFTRIGSWWSRDGKTEIDLIGINELEKTAIFYEIKRNPNAYNEQELKEKVEAFLQATRQLKGYQIAQQGLSMQDM